MAFFKPNFLIFVYWQAVNFERINGMKIKVYNINSGSKGITSRLDYFILIFRSVVCTPSEGQYAKKI